MATEPNKKDRKFMYTALFIIASLLFGLPSFLSIGIGNPFQIIELAFALPWLACVILLVLSAIGRIRLDFASMFVALAAIFLTSFLLLFVLPLGTSFLIGGLASGSHNPIAYYQSVNTGSGTTPELEGGLLYLITPQFPLPYPAPYGIGGPSLYLVYIETASSPLYLSSVPIAIPEWAHLVIAAIAAILLVFGFQILLKRKVQTTVSPASTAQTRLNYAYVAIFAGVFEIPFSISMYGGLLVYLICIVIYKYTLRKGAEAAGS